MNWIKIKDRKPNDSRIHFGLDEDKDVAFFKIISETPTIVYMPGIQNKKSYKKIVEWLEI